jgi:hypothetical protein
MHLAGHDETGCHSINHWHPVKRISFSLDLSFDVSQNQLSGSWFMNEMLIKYIGVKPEDIAFFQFLVEGYEGIGTLTTVDPKKGLLRFSIPEELLADAEEILRLVSQEVALEELSIDISKK